MVLPDRGARQRVVPARHRLRAPPEGALARLARRGLALRSTTTSRQALHIRYAESFAEGLIEATHEFSASFIVVGAARGGLLGRMRVGSVASALLHSSDVPWRSRPRARARSPPSQGVTRITAAIGTRAGVERRARGIRGFARVAHAPLRLLSLVPIDLPSGMDEELADLASTAHADEVLAEAQRALPAGVDATVLTATGASIEESVRDLEWHAGEVVLVGSSRLAPRATCSWDRPQRRCFANFQSRSSWCRAPRPLTGRNARDPRERNDATT